MSYATDYKQIGHIRHTGLQTTFKGHIQLEQILSTNYSKGVLS